MYHEYEEQQSHKVYGDEYIKKRKASLIKPNQQVDVKKTPETNKATEQKVIFKILKTYLFKSVESNEAALNDSAGLQNPGVLAYPYDLFYGWI